MEQPQAPDGQPGPGPATGLTLLTPAESDVLELLATGLSNQAIGERLGIHSKSVERRITRIFTKLGLPEDPAGNRRVLAVLAYLQRHPAGSAGP